MVADIQKLSVSRQADGFGRNRLRGRQDRRV